MRGIGGISNVKKIFLKRLSVLAGGVVVVLGVQVLASHRAKAEPPFSQSPFQSQALSPVGSWYGQALPVNPKTAPFPAVWMMPTIFADGNVMANDSHELNSPHTTAHGNWSWTGPSSIHAVFLWINFGPLGTPDGLGGNFRVTFDGVMNPADPNHMYVTIHPLAFAPGQDPLDPASVPVADGGIFIAKSLTRIQQSKY